MRGNTSMVHPEKWMHQTYNSGLGRSPFWPPNHTFTPKEIP